MRTKTWNFRGFRRGFLRVSIALVLALAGGRVRARGDAELVNAFAAPPLSGAPQVWWHWVNGNVTKEGITADLEAMRRAGIGGATIVNPTSRNPPYTQFDSHEVGSQNWTTVMPAEFKRHNGYDLSAYLLALAGRVVGGTEQTDRVLRDFRRTIANLFAENYFDHMGESARQSGLQPSVEPYGDGPFDSMHSGRGADVVLHRLSVQNGQLTLPDGMSCVLVLPGEGSMTPELLSKVRELALAGATIIGPKPGKSPSFRGYPQCDAKVRSVADELWGGGKVSGRSVGEVFAAMDLPPDFECADKGAFLEYIHRNAEEDDIHFISNQNQAPENTECVFRVEGKVPELWHPDTGLTEKVALYTEENGRTRPSLQLDPTSSVFVVFRRAQSGADHAVALNTAGTYRTTFQVPAAMMGKDNRLYLDLGDVQVIAQVRLHDKERGILWKPAFSVEATDAVQAGTNTLEVKVANLWVNRLIGDEQRPPDAPWHKSSWGFGEFHDQWPRWLLDGEPSPTGHLSVATWRLWSKDDPLEPSGLLGPVTLRATTVKPVF